MAVKGKGGRGLGKGLDTLIPNVLSKDTEKSEPVSSKSKKSVEEKGAETIVKITKVEPNRKQPRKDFNEDSGACRVY